MTDKATNTTYWADAIKKEMMVILSALAILEHDSRISRDSLSHDF
jgi:hypothetical protein